MKKKLLAVTLTLAILLLSGCSAEEEIEYEEDAGTTVTGQVVSMLGNEVTILLVADASSTMGSGMSGMTGGTMPGMTEGTIPEMTEGEIPEMTEGTIPEMTEGTIPEMTGGTSMTVSEEESVYLIPVKTPVYYMDTEYTYTQISEESYISITFDDDGNIISVTIMG